MTTTIAYPNIDTRAGPSTPRKISSPSCRKSTTNCSRCKKTCIPMFTVETKKVKMNYCSMTCYRAISSTQTTSEHIPIEIL
eukprot:TRINITY_DN76123_c0_g1_i1.p2 TRINITY_DN76123_c0_g1~~TRINITY_DN76123_c0_g1_i1.p2  ORF type:complete len:81 (-),score=15.95 TRINITY_DN76123_c0_g1_i1:54-296(-)